jgi:hypothetical protein
LKEGDAKKAHALFDKCLLTYYAFFKEADQDLYVVLFNLGEALWSKGKRSDSLYFFNRILDEQCTNEDLKARAKKRLGVIQFEGESPEAAKANLGPFIEANFETRKPRSFFRVLCLHFLACEKTQADDFEGYFKRLGSLPAAALTQEVYWYFKAFKQFQKVYEEHHNYKENRRFLTLLEEIGKEGRPNSSLNAKRLINGAALIFSEFVGGSAQGVKVKEVAQQSQAIKARSELVSAFYDQFLTVEENAVVIARFLQNLVLVFLHLVPLYNERANNQQFRQKVFDRIEQTVPLPDVVAEVLPLVKSLAAEVQKQSAKVFVPVAREGDDPSPQVPKVSSSHVLANGSPAWSLEHEFNGNAKLQGLVTEFLKQVKNMLFLDVIENVLTYYLRFEASLVELGLNYPKYNFIKQLIRVHLSRAAHKPIDNGAFVSLLDQLFGNHNVSLKDLKLLVILLEAFKDADYLRLFTLYLHRHHQQHARTFLHDLAYAQFNRKAVSVSQQLFEQVVSTRYYELESCYFMHFLESKRFIFLEKQLRFKVFLRARHDMLNDPAMRSVIAEYVTPADLAYFDLRYHVYSAIVKRIKGEETHKLAAVAEFGRRFEEALPRYKHEDAKTSPLLYDIALLAVLTDAGSPPSDSKTILDVYERLIQTCRGNLAFQYSRVISIVGNVCFKLKFTPECIRAKLRAQELLAEDIKGGPSEPVYAPAATREQHQFQIYGFLLVAFLEQGELKAAQEVSDRLEKWPVSDLAIQLNRLVLRALLNLRSNKGTEALKNVFEAIGIFGKLKLTDFLNRLYQAILDKITLMVIERSQNPEEVALVSRKSKTSISKLYEIPAAEL